MVTIKFTSEKENKPAKESVDKLMKIEEKGGRNEKVFIADQNVNRITENEEIKNNLNEVKLNQFNLNKNISKEQFPDLIQKNIVNIPQENKNKFINVKDNNIRHRILSSKTRLGKQPLRPFTASNNRNLIENKDQFDERINKIDKKFTPNSIFSDRPSTGVNKYKQDNNIINININFFNIDLNQRYFDKKTQKKLLHLNNNMIKKENCDSPKDLNILKNLNLQENLKQILNNKDNIGSARLRGCNPFISNNFCKILLNKDSTGKVVEMSCNQGNLKNKHPNKNDTANEKSKHEKKPIIKNNKNERKNTNDFIFHKILSSFDENKKLTIKDFK